MMTIILIGCVKTKLDHKAKAEELYTSDLFKGRLKYAKMLLPDYIYILSAKYGLVGLNDEIEPYNKTLNTMPSVEVKKWANDVINKLSKIVDLKKDKVLFLCGERYRRYIIPHITNNEVLLGSLSQGRQLQFFKKLNG
ncbi:MAG: hypothetical protein M1371_05885 [Actinobacteria bacterium]|nr:hypothetical protein [Actinomycetota bacterium]